MELLNALKEFIKPELLILIPVLILLGLGIKKSAIKSKFIPLLLGIAGIVLCGLYVFATSKLGNAQAVILAIFTAITQGILIAGTSVYFNQLYKQSKIK